MKHYKRDGKVFAFELGQLDHVENDMIEMTSSEIKKHTTPQPTEFHTWSDDLEEWIDPRTPEEIKQQQRAAMQNLSPIEFEIKLYKAGKYDQVKAYIDNVASVPMKIAYNRATFFSRNDSFITTATRDLNLTDEEVDEIWIA